MDFSAIVSEDKIKRAIKDGEFQNLNGLGKPLVLEDLSSVPENLRMAYKMLKNAGMLSETDLKKELMTIDDLMKNSSDNEEREKLSARRSKREYELEKLLEKRNAFSSPASALYKQKIERRLKGQPGRLR
ncbi:DUF1992 domain-containing protein [Metabacillus sp. 84]|uniref:DnaJ family domain-containing protein n=1 Tax=unclassified Metabacillus TaxID=2675274 RepID=UPI003CF98E49